VRKRSPGPGKDERKTPNGAAIGAAEGKISTAGRRLDGAKVDDLCAKIASLPILDTRPSEEILDYDEIGLPR